MADKCSSTGGSLGHKPQDSNGNEDKLRQNVMLLEKSRNKEEILDGNFNQNKFSEKCNYFDTSQKQDKISNESSSENLQSGNPSLQRCAGSRNFEGDDALERCAGSRNFEGDDTLERCVGSQNFEGDDTLERCAGSRNFEGDDTLERCVGSWNPEGDEKLLIPNKEKEEHDRFPQQMPKSPQNVNMSFHLSKSPQKSPKHVEKCQKKQNCRKCPSLKRPITSIIRKFLANRFQASATLQRTATNHEQPSSPPVREAKVTPRVLANQNGDRTTKENEMRKLRGNKDEKLDGEKETGTKEGVREKFHKDKAEKRAIVDNATENEDHNDADYDKRQDNERERRRPKGDDSAIDKPKEEDKEGEEEREESERLNNNNNNNNNDKNNQYISKNNNRNGQDSRGNGKGNYDESEPVKNSLDRRPPPVRGGEERKAEKATQRKKTGDTHHHHHAITSPTTPTRSLISRQIREKTAKLGSPVKTARVTPLQTAKFSSRQACSSPMRVAAKLRGTSSPTSSPAKTLHSSRVCSEKVTKTGETSEHMAKKKGEEDHYKEEGDEEKVTEDRTIKTSQEIRDNRATHNSIEEEVNRGEHRIQVKTTPPAANRKNGFIANLKRIANGTADPLAGLKRGKHNPSSSPGGECCVVGKMRSSPNVRARRLMKEYKVLSKNSTKFFSVDLVNDCLDEWMVRLYRVDQDSLLHRDMQELGVTHILLSLSFPDNFPFHPPFLRVLSPRLEKGFVMEGGAICMELLTPRGWASAYTIEAIIMQFAASLVKGQGRICRKVKGTSGKEFSRRSAESAFKSLVRTHERYGWVTPPLSEG